MSGTCTVTPGYTFSTTGQGELVTNPKLNLMSQPSVSVAAGAITDTEVNASGISGTKIQTGTLPTSALDAATQAKFGYKNYCFNPAFWMWTGGTTFTSGTANADGWNHTMPGISYTISRQAVSAGENDTLLRQSRYFFRCATTTTSSTASKFYNNYIKNPRLFSGQTVTISAAVKVSSGTLPTLSFFVEQYFGTGGSPSSSVLTSGSLNAQPNSQWQQLYATINVPSISGKTLGSTTQGEIRFGFQTANSSTAYQLDITNFQVEYGNVATTFEDIAANEATDDNASATIRVKEAGDLPRFATIGNGLAISSTNLVTPSYSVRVHPVTNQTISSGATTKVQLDTKDIDDNNWFDATTNYRFTPQIAGKFLVSAQVAMTNVGSGFTIAANLEKNGSIVANNAIMSSNATNTTKVAVTDIISVNGSTDYIELFVTNGDSSSRATRGVGSDMWLCATYLGT